MISLFAIPLLAVITYVLLYVYFPRGSIPTHLINHTIAFQEQLISPLIASSLKEHVHELGTYHSNVYADLKAKGIKFVQKSDNETNLEIGEGKWSVVVVLVLV